MGEASIGEGSAGVGEEVSSEVPGEGWAGCDSAGGEAGSSAGAGLAVSRQMPQLQVDRQRWRWCCRRQQFGPRACSYFQSPIHFSSLTWSGMTSW